MILAGFFLWEVRSFELRTLTKNNFHKFSTWLCDFELTVVVGSDLQQEQRLRRVLTNQYKQVALFVKLHPRYSSQMIFD